jgi:hypothetical protein
MGEIYTAASFTKNFSWNRSYKKLYTAVQKGFSEKLAPVTRNDWRERSAINNRDLELIPMNFFLYSKSGNGDDFILVDTLVECAVERPYDLQFAKLALFAFHLANSGSWRNSKWINGRVAGWANLFIRKRAWHHDTWSNAAFQNSVLEEFIEEHVQGTSSHKVFTNYLYMLESAKVLVDGNVQNFDFRERWFLDAVQLFWDREIFDGTLRETGGVSTYRDRFFEQEIYKLLACSEAQAEAFIASAFREYSNSRMAPCFDQLRNLKNAGLIAA